MIFDRRNRFDSFVFDEREAKLFLMRETRDFFLRVLLTRVTIYYLLRITNDDDDR